VELPYYQASRLLVTVAEWRAFVDAGGYDPEAAHWRQAGPAAQAWLHQRVHSAGDWRQVRPWCLDDSDWGWALNPVAAVTAYEAVAYAIWAAPMLDKPAGAPHPPGLTRWHVQLPSEVQWEAAMRAGSDGRPAPLPSRDVAPLDINHSASVWGRPSPVGVFSLGYGPAGQADARGNVWERKAECTGLLHFQRHEQLVQPAAHGPPAAGPAVQQVLPQAAGLFLLHLDQDLGLHGGGARRRVPSRLPAGCAGRGSGRRPSRPGAARP
jgi:formylglycine-generating enzyme required for sulfatase activity